MRRTVAKRLRRVAILLARHHNDAKLGRMGEGSIQYSKYHPHSIYKALKERHNSRTKKERAESI